jgi:LPXTG-motif cell wall-anchored protein
LPQTASDVPLLLLIGLLSLGAAAGLRAVKNAE